MVDPRLAQIGVLSSLVLWGLFGLDLEIQPRVGGVCIAATLVTERLTCGLRGRGFDPRSPLISGLSLTLLLRTCDPWLGALAGGIAVGSKALLRVRGKHCFNPTNLALVALLLTTDRVWVSPGQWGTAPILAAALAGGGFWVLRRARGDVSLAFLGLYAALLFGRAAWLGDPMAIPRHQLVNGGLLIFSLFMISDPRTLPDRRAARIGIAAAVAVMAYGLRFWLHEPNALLYALALVSPLAPLLDASLPGARFEWPPRRKESAHDACSMDPRAVHLPVSLARSR